MEIANEQIYYELYNQFIWLILSSDLLPWPIEYKSIHN